MTTADKLKDAIVKGFYIFLLFSIPICCASGISVVPHFFRLPLIIINSLICLSLIIFSKIKINVTLPGILMVFAVAFLFICSIFSYTPENTLKYALIYLVFSVLLFMDFSEDFFEKALKVINVICLIIAVSIIICPIFNEIAKPIINFVTNPLNNQENINLIEKQFEYFTYAGFAKEVAEAAFIMNIGIATVVAKFLSNFKISVSIVVELVIFISALILTEKRTLFLVPIIAILVLLLVTKARKKVMFITIGSIMLIAVIGLVVGMFYEPFGSLFAKFTSTFDISEPNNRVMLSEFALKMFFFAPILGTGFGSFNQLLFDSGTVYGDGMWQNNAHNIYLQSLGENGVIGTILFFSAFVACAVLCIVNLKKNHCTPAQKMLLVFALYIHILCFVYGITGNVIYNYSQSYTWIFACVISICVSVHLSKCGEKKLVVCKNLLFDNHKNL